jgi:hypothetical protein
MKKLIIAIAACIVLTICAVNTTNAHPPRPFKHHGPHYYRPFFDFGFYIDIGPRYRSPYRPDNRIIRDPYHRFIPRTRPYWDYRKDWRRHRRHHRRHH